MTKIIEKNKSNSIDNSNRRITINTLLIFLPIFFVILSTTFLIVISQEKLEMELYKSAEKSYVDTKLKNVKNEIKHVIHDLLIFTSNSQIGQLWDDQNNTAILENLKSEMMNIVAYHKTYDQARIINEDGMEIIRLNFNDGKPIVVSNDKLQNKKDRYYFYDSFKLNKGEVFISPFDLNVEHGKIEQPLKPMMRFATPVFDDQDKKRGITIFNYLGKNILEQLDDIHNTIIESKLMLVNADGYFLKATNTENEWGFMYDDKKNLTFSSLYFDAWERIKTNESSQFTTQQGLFTFATIYPIIEGQKSSSSKQTANIAGITQLNAKAYNWKIISFIPSKTLFAKQKERHQYISLLLLLFSMSLLFISWKLAKAQHSRKQALQSLKISNDTKDKFFSIISHDLKGPFNALLGFSDLLMTETKKTDNVVIKDYTKIIDATLKNTHNLLINLLEWSRSQRNMIEYNPAPFLLVELVNEIADLLKLQLEKKELQFTKAVPHDLKITADRNMLNTVIRNLVSNALKFTDRGGKITISASIRNNRLHCAVTDTGVGMSTENIKSLYQLTHITSTKGTNNEEGTGLGLILCKELIEKHKGEMGAESEIGKGSTFWFEIPNQFHGSKS